MVDPHEDIKKIFLQLENLKFGVGRLESNAESEKGTVKRMHEYILNEVKKVEDELKDVLYGKDRRTGIIVELDRLKQESEERKKTKQNIFGLWAAVGILLIKEIIVFFTNKK